MKMLNWAYGILENPVIYDVSQKVFGSNRVLKRLRKNIKEQLDHISYCKVLDMGCGTGSFEDLFDGNYFGIDINKNYITKAQEKGIENRHFLVGDVTSVAFDNGSFDLIYTLGVLHHLNSIEQKRMLKEMWRLCKPNGNLIIVDGLVPSNKFNIIGYILAKIDRGGYKVRMEQFKAMLTDSFSKESVISVKNYNFFPFEYVISVISCNKNN